jgi:hypothetical protein
VFGSDPLTYPGVGTSAFLATPAPSILEINFERLSLPSVCFRRRHGCSSPVRILNARRRVCTHDPALLVRPCGRVEIKKGHSDRVVVVGHDRLIHPTRPRSGHGSGVACVAKRSVVASGIALPMLLKASGIGCPGAVAAGALSVNQESAITP